MLRNCSSEVPKEPTSTPEKLLVFEYLPLDPFPLSFSSSGSTLKTQMMEEKSIQSTRKFLKKKMTIFLSLMILRWRGDAFEL